MKVVFMEEVEGTARVGEIKNVADGFARNYLLPRKLAAPATDHYISIAEARAEKEAKRQARLDDEAREHLVPKVEGRSVRIEVRVGEQGKLFGSVTSRDIAEAFQQLTGVELEHRQVDLRQPIREVGVHEITINLTRNVPVQVTVHVEPLGGLPVEGEGEEGEEGEEEEAAGEPEASVEESGTEPEASVGETSEEPETEEAPATEEPASEEPVAKEPEPEEPVAEETAAEEPPSESDEEQA
jgi:large subunit ribosomal protein L9